MMKHYCLIIFITSSLLTSCSTTTEAPSREIASLGIDCYSIIAKILRKAEVSQIVKSTDVKTYIDWERFLNDVRISRRLINANDIKNISEFDFFVRLGLSVDINQSLKIFEGKIISTTDYTQALLSVVNKNIESLTKIHEFDELLSTLEENNFPREFIKAFESNPIIKEYIPDHHSTLFANKSISSRVIGHLLEISQRSSDYTNFFQLIDRLKPLSLAANDVENILSKSPFYASLVQKNPELPNIVKQKVSNEFKFVAKHQIDELETTFRILLLPQVFDDASLSRVNTSYDFLQSFTRGGSSSEVFIKRVSSSPFCHRMKCTPEEIELILKRFENGEDLKKVIHEVYPVYRHDKYLDSANIYDVDLPVVQVKNQCEWGSCWINSTIAHIESSILYATDTSVPISEDYLYIKYLVNAARLKLHYYTWDVVEGNNMYNVIPYVHEWGLVPQSAFKAGSQFRSPGNAASFIRKLNTIADEYHSVAKKNQDSNQELLMSYYKKIDDLFELAFGKIPTKFTYKGQSYTPKTFAKAYLNDDTMPTQASLTTPGREHLLESTQIFIAEKGKVKTKNVKAKQVQLSPEEVLAEVQESLDLGRTVNAAFEWPSGLGYKVKTADGHVVIPFIDNKTGLITSPKKPLTFEKGMGHAVVIVGYELDKNGVIRALKILNSWGVKSGDNGFYHMDVNFFKNYFRYVHL